MNKTNNDLELSAMSNSAGRAAANEKAAGHAPHAAAASGVNTKMLIMAAVFTALTAVCSQIQIPLAPVPINLATFAIFVTAGLLGKKWGTISLVVYVLLGAAGIPVFAGFAGGFGVITGPTGGYIAGYIFTAFITGAIIETFHSKHSVLKSGSSIQRSGSSDDHAVAKKRNVPSYPLLAVAMVAGLAACYLLGTIWFIHLTGWTIGKALMTCVIVFLPGDALKIFAASILVRRIWPAAVRFRANV